MHQRGQPCTACASEGYVNGTYKFERCFEAGHLMITGDNLAPTPCRTCAEEKHSKGLYAIVLARVKRDSCMLAHVLIHSFVCVCARACVRVQRSYDLSCVSVSACFAEGEFVYFGSTTVN